MSNNYEVAPVRASTILTTSYVAWTVVWQNDNKQVQENNQIEARIDFTIWSLTSLEVKFESSDDWVTYYQDTFVSISWGTATATLWEYTFAATWKYKIAMPLKSQFVKISAKGTWTVTGSLCKIDLMVWNA